jgi:hypothetical protein
MLVSRVRQYKYFLVTSRVSPTDALYTLDISKKECRDVPWNVSTRFLENAYLISGDVYSIFFDFEDQNYRT